MLTKLALCLSLTVALLAVPASAFAADVVVPSSVAGSTTVPAGHSSTLTLHCPTEAVALNAAVTRHGDGVSMRRSIPGVGPGDWSFRLSAPAGTRHRGVQAVLRCVRLDLPRGAFGARLLVSTRRPPAIRVGARSSTRRALRCARGYTASGYGFERGARRDLTLAAAIPSARGWDFRVENTGTSSATARLSVRCLKSGIGASRSGASAELRFALTRPVFADVVGRRRGARGTVTHTCAGNQFSVATGHAVDPLDGILVTGGGPAGPRAGRWTFRHASAGDVMTSSMVCLSRHSRFR